MRRLEAGQAAVDDENLVEQHKAGEQRDADDERMEDPGLGVRRERPRLQARAPEQGGGTQLNDQHERVQDGRTRARDGIQSDRIGNEIEISRIERKMEREYACFTQRIGRVG
ncbi:MAG TPA: hypothetical protein VFM14_09330 [Gemmatimonadales bacterium]|nr:hypothetical protein [Gemmatimonadales bacterium]